MKIEYSDIEVKSICEDLAKAKEYFGGQKILAVSLMARINAIRAANVLHDIIIQPQMRFHNLHNKGKHKNLEGYYAIDVKTKKDRWRIIVRPLNEDYSICDSNIDGIAKIIKIIRIEEISNHYE